MADKYNVQIIHLYGATGHGKGLIDAMSIYAIDTTTYRWMHEAAFIRLQDREQENIVSRISL